MGGVRKEGLLQTEVDGPVPVPVSVTGSVAVAPATNTTATQNLNVLNEECTIAVPDGFNSVTAILTMNSPVMTLTGMQGSAASGAFQSLLPAFDFINEVWISTLALTAGASRRVLSFPVVSGKPFSLIVAAYTSGSVDVELIASQALALGTPLTNLELRASSVLVNTELPTAAALADNTANPTAPGVGSFGMVWDGATWDRAAGTSADGTLVNLGVNNDVTVTPVIGSPADNESNTAATLSRIGNYNFVFDGATWDRQRGDSVDGALVNLGANNDITVTSGTLTSLTQMNGQAISMGTGVRAAGTQRVTIATDDLVPVSATNLDIRDLVAATDAVTIHGDVGIADQFNLTNSKPFAVAMVDTNGDQIASFGGGTQYTEDLAAAANPVGTAVNLIRQDTPATLVSTDGDNVAQRGTNYGAGYVQVVTSAGAFVDTFGGGTQYADGAVRGSATGTLAMGDDGANIQSLHCDASGDLQIDILTSALPAGAATAALQTQPGVDIGDVTINNAAGASAVNIQDGGNSITIDGSLTTVSTVTSVTQFNGQAISMGTGVRDAGTQRVTIATNDAVPVTDNAGSLTVDAPVATPVFVRLSDGAAAIATLPVSLAANQSTNVAQLAGTATSVNSGTKDAGTLRVVISTDQPALTNKLLVTPDSVALPANQSTNVNQFGGNAVATGTGTGGVGIPRVTVSNDSTVNGPTLTKGTQGSTGFSTQHLKDAGRNQTNYFMAAGIAGTNAEVMQSLTGYKAGAAVAATVTPAVVTAAKTFRITNITLTYQSLATAGGCLFRLRANLSGTGVIGSPLVATYIIGSAAAVAGITTTEVIPIPDGLEFAAGTGIAVGMMGINTVGAALAAGFGTITINGFEY